MDFQFVALICVMIALAIFFGTMLKSINFEFDDEKELKHGKKPLIIARKNPLLIIMIGTRF